MCQLGCLDPDPAPDAQGYYFAGASRTPEGCTVGLDSDSDGLSDECEYFFAVTFTPEMSFGAGDDVRREPRWAAKWDDAETIRVVYLISYWQDNGSAEPTLCQGFIDSCDPHPGDPEYVHLLIRYNESTHHWYVNSAVFSAHTWHVPFQIVSGDSVPTSFAAGGTGTELEFPDRVGGYPRIWVADGKHANYPTRAYCNSHGALVLTVMTASDECSNPRVTERLEVPYNGNVGSNSVRLIDSVTTQRTDHPAYSQHYPEFYWRTGKPFFGFMNFTSSNSEVTTYGDMLRTAGF